MSIEVPAATPIPRPYRLAVIAIAVSGIVLAAYFAVSRSLAEQPAPGLYRPHEIADVLGRNMWAPTIVPSDVDPVSAGASLLPEAGQVDISYEAPRDRRQILRRALSISVAPSGHLVAAPEGIGQDRRSITIHGQPAELDSWRGVGAGSPADSKHEFRMVRWSEKGLDFLVYAKGLSDREVLLAANSTTEGR